MHRVDDAVYRLALGLATMQLAIQLAERETDEQRRARKMAVVAEKWEVLRSAFPAELDALQGYGGTGPSLRQLTEAYRATTELWPTAHRRLLLIDVVVGDPFAPYELKVSLEEATAAVRELAEPLGLGTGDLETVWQVWSDALTAYRPSRWRRPNAKVKQIPALVPDDFVPPPAPPEPHGEVGIADDAPVPELSGHHHALLSGGSLSGADPDMAGGLWLAEIGPVAAGDGDDERVRRLLALPLSQARTELVKLAMAHALVVRPGYVTTTTTTTVLGALGQLHLAVDDHLAAEQARNDEHAPRIRTLTEVLRAVDVARAHVERVRDAEEARAAAEEAAREAAGDVPPIAESLEPPEELAPVAGDGDPAPAAAEAAPAVLAGPAPAIAAAPTAAAPALGLEQPAEAHGGDVPTSAADLPAGALDGELVVDFFDPTRPAPPAPPAQEARQAAQQRHAATADVVAAAVADVMAMGTTDVAQTPVDDDEPVPSSAAAEAIDGDAPNPLHAPVALVDAADTADHRDGAPDDGATEDAAEAADPEPAHTRRPTRGAA